MLSMIEISKGLGHRLTSQVIWAGNPQFWVFLSAVFTGVTRVTPRTMVGGGVIIDLDFLVFLHTTISVMKGIESLFALNTDLHIKKLI